MRDAARRRPLFAARRVRDAAAQGRVQRLALDHAGRSQDVPLSRRALGRLRRPARPAPEGDALHLGRWRRRSFSLIVLRGRLAGGDFNGANIRMFMYLYGSALYLWRDKIPMSRRPPGRASRGAGRGLVRQGRVPRRLPPCLPLLVLHLAYVPGGPHPRASTSGAIIPTESTSTPFRSSRRWPSCSRECRSSV